MRIATNHWPARRHRKRRYVANHGRSRNPGALQTLDRLFSSVGLDIHDRDSHAATTERLAKRQAYPVRAPCDERGHAGDGPSRKTLIMRRAFVFLARPHLRVGSML